MAEIQKAAFYAGWCNFSCSHLVSDEPVLHLMNGLKESCKVQLKYPFKNFKPYMCFHWSLGFLWWPQTLFYPNWFWGCFLFTLLISFTVFISKYDCLCSWIAATLKNSEINFQHFMWIASMSGWDLKFSRVRWLQMALDYLKFDEVKQ